MLKIEMKEGGASRSAFPSASALAPAPAHLGPLRNALGSLTNLGLLLKSIRVSPRQLFSVISDVHADCGELSSSIHGLERSLLAVGASSRSCASLIEFVRGALHDVERELGAVVRQRKLTVRGRLSLEPVVERAAAKLDAALPLSAFVHRAAQRVVCEPTPVGLLHRQAVEGPRATVSLCLTGRCDLETVAIDLDLARVLLAVAVSVVLEAAGDVPVSMVFERPADSVPRTVVSTGTQSGELVQVASVPLVGPTLACIESAAEGLGARFECDPSEPCVRVHWPV